MHIHKPKAPHGLREFAAEIGVIVVGILIALSLEQIIETMHRSGDVREARESITAEVVTDITRVNQRILNQACVDRRLAELKSLLDNAKGDGHIVRPESIGIPARYGIDSARWEAASHSGRLSLVGAEEQSKFGMLYTMLTYFYEMENGEQLVWARMRALESTDSLTPDGMLAMRSTLGEARFYNQSIRQVAPMILDRARAVGASPSARNDGQSSVCFPMTQPAADSW